ncbi:hypothetical protein RB594_000207 [Gaeumannomyces avenae]
MQPPATSGDRRLLPNSWTFISGLYLAPAKHSLATMRFSRLVVLALAPLGLAQSAAEPSTTPSVTPPTTNSSTPAAAAPAVPLCAAKCLALGVARSFCATVTPAAEQRKCTCSNQELQLDVATCVAANCTVKESIRFQGVSKANCGVRARDESKSYYVVTIVFAVLAWALVLSRIGFKFFALGVHELCWDDLFIFLTAAITIPSAVITCNGTLANGLGKDIWIVPVEQIYVFLEFFFAMTIFYFVQVGMLKMSLLFFYLRIFPAKPVKRILWATVAVNALVTVLYVILDVIQCSPISLFWTKWDGESNSKCIMEINDLVVSNAVVSIVLDLWMLAVPTWQLRGLQLHWKKKVGVAAMFAVGTLFTVLSCVRLEILIRMGKNPKNPTYDQLEISTWSTIEITVGIICACMPTFRMLLVRLFPRLGNITSRGYAYGSRGGGRGGAGGGYGSSYAKGSRSRSTGPSVTLGSRSAHGGSVGGGGGGNGGSHIPLKDLKTPSATSSVARPASPVPPSSIPAGAIRMQTEYSVTSTPHYATAGQSPLSRNGLQTREGEHMRDEYDDQSRLVIQRNTPSPELTRHKGTMI